MSVTRDRWAEWLAVRRFGGDPDVRRLHLERLSATRDRVLDLAEPLLEMRDHLGSRFQAGGELVDLLAKSIVGHRVMICTTRKSRWRGRRLSEI